MKPVWLLSDMAVWVLLISLSAFFWYARRREQYRIAWRQMKVRKIAMMCFGIVALYAAVGVLDSFHFQLRAQNAEGKPAVDVHGNAVYSTEVLSFLDVILSDLKKRNEKTFSAPFAVHGFMREQVVKPDGTSVREFPRLKHGGAHLQQPSDAGADVALLAGKGLGIGLGVGLLLCGGLYAWKRNLRSILWAGGFITGVCILVGVAATVSSQYHILGTDRVGTDVLYTALKGCRTALILGIVTTLIVTPFAMAFGVSAGYFGGKIDDAIQYLYTVLGSIPSILLIMAVMLIIQTNIRTEQTILTADRQLFWLCITLGIVGWTGLCRLLRGETLKIRELEYVQAAHAFGVGNATIMGRHIVPNLTHLILISVVLRFSGLVLAEAVLAYVGVGVHPSTESWGNMINGARTEITRDPGVWWNLAAAFVFMFGLVLPANVFGDAVRDALDPRLRTE